MSPAVEKPSGTSSKRWERRKRRRISRVRIWEDAPFFIRTLIVLSAAVLLLYAWLLVRG